MALSASDAEERATELLRYHDRELESLNEVYRYWHGQQSLPVVPTGVPSEVRRMAQSSRTNVVALVISVMAQALYVDGYRDDPNVSEEDAPGWQIWQANNMDAHQTGVHRAALAYGAAYVIVLPGFIEATGEDFPVLRGVSPRSLVGMYEEESRDWPFYALEQFESPWSARTYRLYDEEAVYTLGVEDMPGAKLRQIGPAENHDLGVCPVIRFRNVDQLNEPPPPPTRFAGSTAAYTGGEVEPLMALQDQLDLTKFDQLVAQHFQSFRQRYILGWAAEEEQARAKATASRLWTFESPDVKVGEFGQVDLKGYLDSAEQTITQLGVISQTPSHELLGKMSNLSAEALVAAETGQRRKVLERQNLFGESWEQALGLASRSAGIEVADSAQVRWRDTEARSLAQTVDALLKLSQMGVPPDMLWERIPGITQADVARWRAAAAEGDSLAALTDMLGRQMGTLPGGAPAPPAPIRGVA